MADKKPAAKNPPSWTKFVNGGLSGMIATCFVQPLGTYLMTEYFKNGI